MKTRRLLAAFLLPLWMSVLPARAADAPDQNLRIVHHVSTIGQDGVQRETRYAERMFRRDGAVWIEREMPAALLHHDDDAHDAKAPAHAGHAHAGAIAAPLWVQRGADGRVHVTMVLRAERKLIDVGPAEYGNVGYGGSWAAAYWVLDPAQLSRLGTVGPARAGVQRYEGVQDGRWLRVDWDVAGQYPRRIERRDAHGTFTSTTTATPMAAPRVLPWREVQGYERGEYSDLLD